MDLKNRRMLMGIADIGELPAGLSFVSFRKPNTIVFTVQHGLGVRPDMVMIFPNTYDAANGVLLSNPNLIFANQGIPQASGYEGRLIINGINAKGEWDYTGNANFGWSADNTEVTIKIASNSMLNNSDTWYMLSVKFN